MNLSKRFNDLPIRRKLTLVVLAPCILVFLLAGTALLGFQLKVFRSDFKRDITAVAEIVAANAAIAIESGDIERATLVLKSLSAKQNITSAILVLPDDSVFASYGQHSRVPVFSDWPLISFDEMEALVVKPVRLDGRQVGTLNLVSDYRTVNDSLVRFVGYMLTIFILVGLLFAARLSNWLQRLISDPLMRVARTAQVVAERNDYAVRAREESGSELGVLTRAFNQMLTRIQQQDQALTHSQRRVEQLINSIEGIVWECTAVGFHFTFVSRQSERLLGYTPEQWIADPRFWHNHLHPNDAARALELSADSVRAGKPYTQEYRMLAADGRTVWIRESGTPLIDNGAPVAVRGIFIDITEQKVAAQELTRLNNRLVETSRLAGMAEVATGVLHNVGNVLNSVSVSAGLVSDSVKRSKVQNLRRAAEMLQSQNGTLSDFLTRDPKGKVLPSYLVSVSEELAADQNEILKEIGLLTQHIDHIKQIVAMQQSYAKVSGAFESLGPVELVEDALKMNAAAFDRHRIEVTREYAEDLPRVNVDRHKVLQILINLIRNAKYAMDADPKARKKLLVQVQAVEDGKVAIRVRDNGIGIAAENQSRIFSHGFTTKRDGHGFGLHSGANSAKEMGGRLFGVSDGVGQGAEFTLELPVCTREHRS